MTETWRPISNFGGIFEHLYQVSDRGRVRSLGRTVSYVNFKGKTVRYQKPGRIMRAPASGKCNGYERLWLKAGGGVERSLSVHELVLTAFVGPRPEGLVGCHNDGDSRNNAPSNLRWDTHSANNYDRVAHGRHPKTQRTHCPRNHPLQMPNLRPEHFARGHRGCLACSKALAYLRLQRRTGRAVPDLQEVADRYYAALVAVDAEPSVRRCRKGHPLTAESIVRHARQNCCRACLADKYERRRAKNEPAKPKTPEQRQRASELQRVRRAQAREAAALAVEMARSA